MRPSSETDARSGTVTGSTRLDCGTSLTDFADTFAAKTNSLDVPDIHPAAGATIFHWLCEMRAAAEHEQSTEVARYARMVAEKVALERQLDADREIYR
jgi:hypothetical protein